MCILLFAFLGFPCSFFPSVLWYCWLDLLTCKNHLQSHITYTVLVGTLNHAQSNPKASFSITAMKLLNSASKLLAKEMSACHVWPPAFVVHTGVEIKAHVQCTCQYYVYSHGCDTCLHVWCIWCDSTELHAECPAASCRSFCRAAESYH